MSDQPQLPGGGSYNVPSAIGAPPPGASPGEVHSLTSFPVALHILLHYLSCGIFSLVWLNLMHGRLPRTRSDDPSAAKAIGFSFIPFFNLYWIFFTSRRLCERVDEQRVRYGLAPGNHTGMATAACVFQVIPYANILIGYTIMWPIYAGLIQASMNELVETSATTTPLPASTSTLPPARGMPVWALVLIICCCSIGPVAILAGLLLPALAKAKQKAERIQCVSNLKQVGLAFRLWEADHGDQYPFNVSTNTGGTLELCAPGMDGLDQNSWQHFQVISNELNTPVLLVCHADHSKTAAPDFAHLTAANVTYQVCSGTNINDTHPELVLAICPIHHNVLMADGSVQQLSESAMRKLLSDTARSQ